MFTRVARSLLLVAALTAALAAPAFAEGDDPGLGRGLGQVTALGEASFTVVTRAGVSHTLLVDDQTTFETRSGEPQSFADVLVGDWLAGTYDRNEEGALLARRVIILGEELPQIDVRAAGEIAAVDLASSAFALHTRQGEDLTFTTTDQTRFRIRGSEGGALGDLEVGMRAGVVAEGEDDGTLVALVVVAVDPQDRPEVVRFAGEITGVVPGQGTLSLHTRGGEDVTFQTNERTRFRSRDGSIESIHDLRQGMVALVGAVEGDDGALLALVVAAGDRDDLPGGRGVDVRAAGRITSVGDNTFTLENLSGETMTFAVDGSTVFRSRDGSVHGIGDLVPGMRAVIGAKELGSGELRAVWVGAGRPPAAVESSGG